MKNITQNFSREENVVFALRELYRSHGYKKYTMSKFEEYDLYWENKYFLQSQDIITFHDLHGKLLALKPDVTLSIAKNLPKTGPVCEKLYYNENVYRTVGDTKDYKEIMQTGVECIGDVDTYSVFEIIALAEKSLKTIGRPYILDISHMGIINGLLDSATSNRGARRELIRSVSEKNAHGIAEICAKYGISGIIKDILISAATIYEPLGSALSKLESFDINVKTHEAIAELRDLYELLEKTGNTENVNIDLSMISHTDYYNGIVFKGFIDGVFEAVLLGGRYDNLLKKFGKDCGAIGFAVCLNLLEERPDPDTYDVDMLIIYDGDTDITTLCETAGKYIEQGLSVRTQKTVPDNLRCRDIVYLTAKEGK